MTISCRPRGTFGLPVLITNCSNNYELYHFPRSWRPQETFETGIEKTVRWYLDNESWWRPIVAQGAAQRRGVAA